MEKVSCVWSVSHVIGKSQGNGKGEWCVECLARYR